MAGQRFWIVQGREVHEGLEDTLTPEVENARFNRDGAVRVTMGDEGSEIKWAVFSPCFASLYYAMEWLPTARLPIVLRFNLSGWFEETCQTVEQAIMKIERILSKSDIHLTRKTFVEEFDPNIVKLSPLLQKIWTDKMVVSDLSIDCVYEEKAHKFRVDRVGPLSTVAKLYGTSQNSYSYLDRGSYDEIVCAAYKNVLNSGKPRYDHVLAALRMPDNVVHWVPYHRIVIPKVGNDKRYGVSVVTEIAHVNITPI